MFRGGYIAGNNKSNQEHIRDNKKNIDQKRSFMAKDKYDKN